MVARGCGVGGWGLGSYRNGQGDSAWEEGEILEVDGGDGCTRIRVYLTTRS